MADYLKPFSQNLTIEEKRKIFAIRNRMIDIGNNFGRNERCIMCGKNEDMSHIYQCEYLNEQQLKIEYEKIFNGNLIEQTKVFRIFEQNMKRRNKEKLIERNPPCDPFCDPLNCGKFSIGYIDIHCPPFPPCQQMS